MRAWSHAVMLLLGVSVTVGFYEGRRLVTNTMRALSVGETSAGLATRLEPDAPDASARRDDPKRVRSASRRATSERVPTDDERAASTPKSRHRLRPAGPEPGRDPAIPVDELADDLPLALPADPAVDDTGEPAP